MTHVGIIPKMVLFLLPWTIPTALSQQEFLPESIVTEVPVYYMSLHVTVTRNKQQYSDIASGSQILAKVGDTLSLICSETDNNYSTIRWLDRDDKEVPSTVLLNKTAVYDIAHVHKTDFTTYNCRSYTDTRSNYHEHTVKLVYRLSRHALGAHSTRSYIMFTVVLCFISTIVLISLVGLTFKAIRKKYMEGKLTPNIWYLKLAYFGSIPPLTIPFSDTVTLMDIGNPSDVIIIPDTQASQHPTTQDQDYPLLPDQIMDNF